jgi:hypothetical protein
VPDMRRVAGVMALKHLLGAPVSHEKTTWGKRFDWSGYDVDLVTSKIGLTDKKAVKLAKLVDSVVDEQRRVPFPLFENLTAKMGWWAVACPQIKPFVTRAYSALARVKAMGFKRAGIRDHSEIRHMAYKRMKSRWWIPVDRIRADVVIWRSFIRWRPLWSPRCLAKRMPGIWWRSDAAGSQSTGGLGGWMPRVPFEPGTEESLALVDKAHWFQVLFSEGAPLHPVFNKQPRFMTSALEFLAALLAYDWVARRLRQADPHGPDLEIACESDSMVSVLAQRSSKTGSPIMNWVHRELVLREIKWRVCLKLVHLPGVKNGLADGLSRDYVDVVAKFDPRRRLNVDFTRFWWQSMPSYLEKSLGLVTTGTVFEQNIM